MGVSIHRGPKSSFRTMGFSLETIQLLGYPPLWTPQSGCRSPPTQRQELRWLRGRSHLAQPWCHEQRPIHAAQQGHSSRVPYSVNLKAEMSGHGEILMLFIPSDLKIKMEIYFFDSVWCFNTLQPHVLLINPPSFVSKSNMFAEIHDNFSGLNHV